jgi:hypothetical protein
MALHLLDPRIPRSVRDRIYHHVFVSPTARVRPQWLKFEAQTTRGLPIVRRQGHAGLEQEADAWPLPNFALLQACRQIYDEARHVFWHQNIFSFRHGLQYEETMNAWVWLSRSEELRPRTVEIGITDDLPDNRSRGNRNDAWLASIFFGFTTLEKHATRLSIELGVHDTKNHSTSNRFYTPTHGNLDQVIFVICQFEKLVELRKAASTRFRGEGSLCKLDGCLPSFDGQDEYTNTLLLLQYWRRRFKRLPNGLAKSVVLQTGTAVWPPAFWAAAIETVADLQSAWDCSVTFRDQQLSATHARLTAPPPPHALSLLHPRVPPEIRSLIYGYALSPASGRIEPSVDLTLKERTQMLPRSSRRVILSACNWTPWHLAHERSPLDVSLLFACRQIQAEASRMLFGRNIFCFHRTAGQDEGRPSPNWDNWEYEWMPKLCRRIEKAELNISLFFDTIQGAEFILKLLRGLGEERLREGAWPLRQVGVKVDQVSLDNLFDHEFEAWSSEWYRTKLKMGDFDNVPWFCAMLDCLREERAAYEATVPDVRRLVVAEFQPREGVHDARRIEIVEEMLAKIHLAWGGRFILNGDVV